MIKKLSPYGRVKVYWNDRPENYSRSNRNSIRNKFAKKYGIDKDKVKVVYRPVKMDNKGNLVKLDGVSIDNIGDVNYQRQLFKEWLDREKKDVNFAHLMQLDDKVNSELDSDVILGNNKRWEFEWVMVDNFLSFGDSNYFPINKFNGLTTVTSDPPNQGGKSTLIIDAFKFLLFGTTSKTNKNEQIFNRYRDKDSLAVRGLMKIESEEEFIVERLLTRKQKKFGGWLVKNVVNYYRILPDGEEEKMNEEDAVQTTKKIRETVGGVDDFDLVTLATGKNLDSLIDFSVTENGKIFTKFIGLEIMEIKESIARKMYNEFQKSMKSNVYNIVDLNDQVTSDTDMLSVTKDLLVQADEKKTSVKSELNDLDQQRGDLFGSKEKIDEKLLMINPDKVNADIADVTKLGIKYKDNLKEITNSINEIGDVFYDEYKEKRLNDELNGVITKIGISKNDIITHQKNILALQNSEICGTCKRPLDGIDNTENINELESEIEKIEGIIIGLEGEMSELKIEIDSMKDLKEGLNKKQRLELERDRISVKLDELRNKLKELNNLKREYEANVKAIEFNKKVEANISFVKSKIQVKTHEHEELVRKVESIKNEITTLTNRLEQNTILVKHIEKEFKVEKLYKLYIDMVGKKGVSKIVLRSVLPIVNSELERLLEGVCDFDIEVRMDEKNDVHLIILKDGVEGLLKSTSGFERTVSGVALRCVLGVVSTLPMPNFIAFDEVLDKVANENIPNMKPLFDKIKDMYDKVFVITHDDLARDWSNKIITITKSENVSTINYI